MKIYNLTSMFYFDRVIEDGTAEMVDTYNTNIAPPDGATNPRFIEGAWVDVLASDKLVQDNTERIRVKTIAAGLKYLSGTDWYVSRKAETGTAIPSEILTKRAQARIDASE